MANSNGLVIVITCGLSDERMSVAWSVANGAVASGMELTVFLAASGVDCVRKGAADQVRLNPLDPPVGEMIATALAGGARILACPPCSKVRGYGADSFIDGVTLAGSVPMLEIVRSGASTLSF